MSRSSSPTRGAASSRRRRSRIGCGPYIAAGSSRSMCGDDPHAAPRPPRRRQRGIGIRPHYNRPMAGGDPGAQSPRQNEDDRERFATRFRAQRRSLFLFHRVLHAVRKRPCYRRRCRRSRLGGPPSTSRTPTIATRTSRIRTGCRSRSGSASSSCNGNRATRSARRCHTIIGRIWMGTCAKACRDTYLCPTRSRTTSGSSCAAGT